MNIYPSKISFFTAELSKINRKYNLISLLRLGSIALFLLSLYYYFQQNSFLYLLFSGFFLVIFIGLMRRHSRLQFQKKLNQALLNINQDELDFLKRKKIPFENGEEFQDFHHTYAYDLDIFGNHSLFQSLNRTATFIGKKTLATSLLDKTTNDEIIANQQAIEELKTK